MTWKRKIMGFFVLISLVLCMVVPIETRAAVMRSGKWVTRVGEVFSVTGLQLFRGNEAHKKMVDK